MKDILIVEWWRHCALAAIDSNLHKSMGDVAASAEGIRESQQNGAAPAAPPQDPPDFAALMRAYEAKVDARLGDIGRQMARLKEPVRPEPSTQSPTAAAPGLTAADWRAMRALDRAMDGLPDLAREHLEQIEANGATPSEMLSVAKAIRLGMSAGGTPAEPAGVMPVKPRTTDRPATGPSRTAVTHPRSLSAYYELARSNPEAKKLLDKDPTFHPEDLAHRE